MKLDDHHHSRTRDLSLEYEALLVKLPQELQATAVEYISNFMDAMMMTPLDIASHWLHMITLNLMPQHLSHQERKAVHDLYTLAMRDLTKADRAQHERRQRALQAEKLRRQTQRTKMRTLTLLSHDTKEIP